MAKRKQVKPTKRRPVRKAPKAKAKPARGKGAARMKGMVVERAMAGGVSTGSCQLMSPAGGSTFTTPASINVVFSVGDPTNTVACKQYLCPASQVPSDPATVPSGATDLTKDLMNPSRWTGMLTTSTAGNYVVLAWAFVKTFDCRDSASVTVNQGP